MARLVVTENITLDGVIEDPETWAGPWQSNDLMQYLNGRLSSSENAILFGRVTYEKFSAFWPDSDIEPFATKLNTSPKYVASTTLTAAPWGDHAPAVIIGPDLPAAIARLKAKSDRDISVLGSARLVQLLIAEKLADELLLFVHPLILGTGKRLFNDGNHANFELLEARSFSGGVVLMRYGPA